MGFFLYPAFFHSASGGLIFLFLDQLLSGHGGYLRKGAYVIAQHSKNKSKRQSELIQSIGNSSFFSSMSPELMNELLKLLHPKFIVQGEALFNTGDASHERSRDRTSPQWRGLQRFF